jgi:iron complex transport system ATP-binding protein
LSYSLQHVGMRYGDREVLRDITTHFDAAQLTAIAGPNGAGKSTLIGILAGVRDGFAGVCAYAGRDIRKWPRRALARRVALVPQSLRLDFPFTAEQVVMMGRSPYSKGLFEAPGDYEAVERAMRITDVIEFRHRDFRSLSGGERQRVVLASALAQSPEFLLLDEPATYLDLKHQVAVYRLLRDMRTSGVGVVTVTHDLNTALTYADRVVLLYGGGIAADGAPAGVLTPVNLERIFGVHAIVQATHGRAWIAYEA